MKAGAAYVPIDSAAPALRMAAAANDCRIAGLVTIGARAAEIEQAFGNRPTMRAIWYIDDGPALGGCPTVAWREAMSEGGATANADLDGEDLASVAYTSGTTGLPKGVMVSHRAILWHGGWLADRARSSPRAIGSPVSRRSIRACPRSTSAAQRNPARSSIPRIIG